MSNKPGRHRAKIDISAAGHAVRAPETGDGTMVEGSRCITTTRRALLRAGLALPFLSLPARAQPADGILRFGLSAFPPNLQPWVSTGAAAGTVKLMLHRSL